MNTNNKVSILIPKLLLGLFIIGIVFLWLIFGGIWKFKTTIIHYDSSRLYALVIGISLILPYIFYLFKTKSKPLEILKNNPINFSKADLTMV